MWREGPAGLWKAWGPLRDLWDNKHLPSEKGTAPGGTHVSVPASWVPALPTRPGVGEGGNV